MNRVMQDLERIVKGLANRRRLAILKHLRQRREASVTDIARAIKLSFKSTSRHLSVLGAARLLEHEQRGLQVFYRLSSGLPLFVRQLLTIL